MVTLPRRTDSRGSMTYLEKPAQIPFEIESVEWQAVVPGWPRKSSVNHSQLLISIKGTVRVHLNAGNCIFQAVLSSPEQGIIFEPGIQYQLESDAPGVVLVLGSSGDTHTKQRINVEGWCDVSDHAVRTGENENWAWRLEASTFPIKRVYYLYHLTLGATRGGHAHKMLEGLMIAPCGRFNVQLSNESRTQTFVLDRPETVLYIPKLTWRELNNFSEDAVCLVLANGVYAEDEMIRNPDLYIQCLKKNGENQ